MEQTVTQWLNQLSEPYKTQALANILYDRGDRMCDTMSTAIDRGMSWADTPQGHEYWSRLRGVYLDMEANTITTTTFDDAIKELERQQAEKLARMVTYSASMKDMLNKLSDDCRVSRILTNNDFINNSFCNYITTRGGMLSYLPNGREHRVNEETGRWLRDGRQEMKPAKLARRLINQNILEGCEDSDFEKFGNKVRAYLGIVGDEDGEGRNIKLEVVQGDAIKWAYYGGNYSNVLGTGSNLHGSCMRGSDQQHYFGIYTKNEDKVQLLVAKDTEGKVLGRALLWNFDDGDKGMDTIYGADMIVQVFKDWAIDNGYWYKSNQSCHHHDFNVFNTEIFERGKLSSMDKLVRCVTISEHDFDHYPYVDSLYYLCDDGDKQFLCNEDDYKEKTLRCTGGSYEEADEDDNDDESYVTLENGDRVHEDDACYLDYTNFEGDNIEGYYPSDDCVYINRVGSRLADDCVRLGGAWYEKDSDDIVWVDSRDEYYLSEDTVYCEYSHETLHIDDAVCLCNGEYCDRNIAYKCAVDNEWYHEDDMIKLDSGVLIAKDNEESYLEQLKEKENETEREGTIA